ncbi:crotonase/enoyl-CoA hydratase family protein [Mycobacterium sp. M1]|uniref:Crotonase/enoyl-CoA hydratase family protein n=1 Tax=Mycolicibacter acidiphilus TaxID=2835306 RepID=A0ABS5RPH0_9MYCO|nr:crotonase/enoyl-CoA hydratase family protein [Mycolicibacter acidiphilus]MBS9536111.1 crotonase/enoyl-CoA hydratase family protein [Mycolicibacter acidiphilus]
MSETAVGTVRKAVDGHICVITIDNVTKKNAITPEMMQQLASQLTEFDDDPELWVAVITAEGEHTTAGLDMTKFFGPQATAQDLPEGSVDPFGLQRRCRKPVITAVQGITYTVGIELMLAGDIVIAADTARFAQIEAKRGIAPFGGAHFRYLTRTSWGNAMYLLFTCEEFSAQRALELGLVQEVHPFGRHLERALEIARQICTCAPIGVRATKEAAMTFLDGGEKAAINAIPEIRRQVFESEDCMEGIQSFIERREAVFRGR